MPEAFPTAGPLDTLTGYPLSAQENSTGLLAPYSIGWSIALVSYGLMLSSLVRYLKSAHYSRDGPQRKAIVWSVVLLNTGVTVQIFENSLFWSTLQRRSTANLEAYRSWGVVGPVLSGVLALIVQSVYAARASKLFKSSISKYFFLAAIIAGMLAAVTGALMEGALSALSSLGRIDEAKPLTIQFSSALWLWSSAAVDTANTITLCYLLWSRVNGFSASTDGVLKMLILLAVETASYTTVMALAGAIVSVSFRHVTDHNADIAAAFWIPLPSLYAVSLFTTLASRDRLANQLNGSGSASGKQRPNTYRLDGVRVELSTIVAHDDLDETAERSGEKGRSGPGGRWRWGREEETPV